MGRKEIHRIVEKPPKMLGFRPFGIPVCKLEYIIITLEEYESLRLIEYEGLQQKEAADEMGVSRPTVTRIYNRVLKKISTAFIEGKAIKIEGGNYRLNSDWYRCKSCHKLYEGMRSHKKCGKCKGHKEELLERLNK